MAALLTVSRQPILKWILVTYFLLKLLLTNDIIRWTAEALSSKELMNGHVLRILVLHVIQ